MSDGEALPQPPLVRFDEAEAIGRALHDRFEAMTGRPAPLAREDLGWADIVQFVIRQARAAADAREGAE